MRGGAYPMGMKHKNQAGDSSACLVGSPTQPGPTLPRGLGHPTPTAPAVERHLSRLFPQSSGRAIGHRAEELPLCYVMCSGWPGRRASRTENAPLQGTGHRGGEPRGQAFRDPRAGLPWRHREWSFVVVAPCLNEALGSMPFIT